MIFTFRANMKKVEDAAIKEPRARAQGRPRFKKTQRATDRAALQKDWQQWLDQIKDKPREEWPPPPGSDNGASNGAGENGKA